MGWAKVCPPQRSRMMVLYGQVKWFNDARGFGFLTSPEGDVFAHVDQVQGRKGLAVGERVSFVVVKGKRGPRAMSICRVTGP